MYRSASAPPSVCMYRKNQAGTAPASVDPRQGQHLFSAMPHVTAAIKYAKATSVPATANHKRVFCNSVKAEKGVEMVIGIHI